MQVLVLAVQNAVDYEVLGAATSGVTLLRGIGGSLGAAVFGTIFTSRLARELQRRAARAARRTRSPSGGRLTGAQVAGLPPPARARLRARLRRTRCSPVFLAAAGVAAARLRAQLAAAGARRCATTAATSTGLEDSLAAPRSPDSLAEIERALTRAMTTPEQRERFRERAGRARRHRAQPRRDLGARANRRARRSRAPASSPSATACPPSAIGGSRRRSCARDGLVAGEDGAPRLTPDRPAPGRARRRRPAASC